MAFSRVFEFAADHKKYQSRSSLFQEIKSHFFNSLKQTSSGGQSVDIAGQEVGDAYGADAALVLQGNQGAPGVGIFILLGDGPMDEDSCAEKDTEVQSQTAPTKPMTIKPSREKALPGEVWRSTTCNPLNSEHSWRAYCLSNLMVQKTKNIKTVLRKVRYL